jgi:uncharacterized delta-60 repeat protein
MRAVHLLVASACLGTTVASAVATGCDAGDAARASTKPDGGDNDALALDAGPSGDGAQEVDPPFADGGLFTWAYPIPFDQRGEAIVRQADGKLVAITLEVAADCIDVVRFTADGVIDQTFGTGSTGHAIVAGIGKLEGGRVALAPDGKLLVFGISYTELRSMIVRLDANGSIDTTWGSEGVVRFATGVRQPYVWGIAVQSDGKVVVAGGAAPDARVMRFDTGGAPDTSFGNAGVATLPFNVSLDGPIAIDSIGRIVVGGEHVNLTSAVVRLTSEGLPDGTFDSDGIASIPNFAGVTTIATDSASRVYIAGHYGPSDTARFARLDANGALDTAFNAGKVIYTEARANSIGIDPDGRSVLFSGYDIARYDTGGALDTSFATNGKRVFSEPFTTSGLVLPDGSFINVGDGHIASPPVKGDRRLFVAKRTPAGSDDTEFGDAGYATTSFNGTRDVASTFEIAPDNKTLVLASSDAFSGTNLLRVTAGGKLDPTFGDGGVVAAPQTYFVGLALDASGGALLLRVVTGGFVVRRYDPAGNVDSSFGTAAGGGIMYSVDNGYAVTMGTHADGRLVVAGTRESDIYVYRVGANGTPDTTFGGGGVSFVPTGASVTKVGRVVGLADGSVVVAGILDGQPSVVRFAAAGGPAAGFGVNGVARGVSTAGRVRAVGIQPDGRIVVLATKDLFTEDYVVERFDAAGKHDTSFGTSGVIAHAEGHHDGAEEGPDMAVDSGGRVYVATVSVENGHDEMAVFRYTADGQPDPTWGPSGRRLFTKSIGVDAARGIRIRADGKLIIGGRMFTQTGASDLALARVIP